MTEEKDMSRRRFLRSGILAAGALAVGGSVFGFGSNTAQAAEAEACGSTCEVPAFPWPYVQLDPEKAKLAGYQGYGKYKCSYGAFDAIIGQLKEKVGYPYTTVPTEVLQWGGTGGGGWGTLCGALTGAATAINYTIGDKKQVDKLVSELFGWYCNFDFPHFQPAAGKALEVEGEIKRSVAGSPLCHVSVSIWCDASGLKAESAARSERCARITGDVAAKAIELLNQYHSQTFKAVYKNEAVEDCMICHGKGHSLENTRGMMDCNQCHTDVDPNNLLEHIKKSWDLLK